MKKNIVYLFISMLMVSTLSTTAFAKTDITNEVRTEVTASDIGYQVQEQKINYEKVIGKNNIKIANKQKTTIHRSLDDIDTTFSEKMMEKAEKDILKEALENVEIKQNISEITK